MLIIDIAVLTTLILFELLAIAVNVVYAEPQNAGFDFWADFGWWFDKIGIASVVVTLFVYLHEQKAAKTKEKDFREDRFKRSRLTLLQEISQMTKSLPKYDRLFFSYIKNKQTIDYINIVFDTYAYQSIIHSGLLTYFEVETQANLAQLYSRIDSYNETLDYRVHLDTEFSIYGQSDDVQQLRDEKEKYDIFLTETLGAIKDLYPEIILSLGGKLDESMTTV